VKLEAPPGFEPGMEVLQTGPTNENRPETSGFWPVFVLSIGWRWTAFDRLLTAFDHNRDHSTWQEKGDSPGSSGLKGCRTVCSNLAQVPLN